MQAKAQHAYTVINFLETYDYKTTRNLLLDMRRYRLDTELFVIALKKAQGTYRGTFLYDRTPQPLGPVPLSRIAAKVRQIEGVSLQTLTNALSAQKANPSLIEFEYNGPSHPHTISKDN